MLTSDDRGHSKPIGGASGHRHDPGAQRSTRHIAASFRPGPTSDFIFVSLLTLVAGFFDAAGYVELSHLYVSFMSGNTTHLGMAIAQREWGAVATAVCVVATFIAGSAAGTAVADRTSRTSVFILGGEQAVLVLALISAGTGHTVAAFILVAFVMGMQNVLHHTVAGADVGKSFVTGALFSLGQALARITQGRSSLLQAASNGLSWVSFLMGVVGGAMSLSYLGAVYSLIIATLFITTLFIAALARWFL